MAEFEKLAGKLLNLEGGFVDHPKDRGGATKYGVILNTWIEHGYDKDKDGDIDVQDLKVISHEDAKMIAKKIFWDYFKADKIKNQSIAELIVDWGYNSGRVTVARRIQRLLNIEVDGVFGAKTLDAINKSNQSRLFQNIKQDRKEFIQLLVRRDPSQQVFYKGWMNRINSFFFLQAANDLLG